jgi:hypothetical protein
MKAGRRHRSGDHFTPRAAPSPCRIPRGPSTKASDMTAIEEQQMIHGISGLAQGMQALLKMLVEASEQRKKADEEMITLLKLISRKH